MFELKFINEIKQQDWYIVFPKMLSWRGNKPIIIIGSNKENIWLSFCLRQIASAYISIFPKPLWSRQEHGPAKGKTERETARIQNVDGLAKETPQDLWPGELKRPLFYIKINYDFEWRTFLLLHRKEDFKGKKGKSKKKVPPPS